MSYRCINPDSFQNNLRDAGPPEYESSNVGTCSRCDDEFDKDDDEYAEDEHGYVCESCRYVCELCGDFCGDFDSEESRIVNGSRVCVECIRCGEDE